MVNRRPPLEALNAYRFRGLRRDRYIVVKCFKNVLVNRFSNRMIRWLVWPTCWWMLFFWTKINNNFEPKQNFRAETKFLFRTLLTWILLSLTIYFLNERKYLSLFDFAVLWKQGGKLAICFSTIFFVDEAAPKVTSGKLWKTLNYISKDLAF